MLSLSSKAIAAYASDGAVVVFGGRVVVDIPADMADEPTLIRSAYGLGRETVSVGILTAGGPRRGDEAETTA